MLYAAKCFWPGVTEEMLREAATRAGSATAQRPQAVFRGALFLLHDELVLCLFEGSTGAEVKRASEQAGMPCERVIETVWVVPREE
jgi:Nickel responsive protein SCO4226-like